MSTARILTILLVLTLTWTSTVPPTLGQEAFSPRHAEKAPPRGPLDRPLRRWLHNGFKVGPNYHEPPAPVAFEWIDLNRDPRVKGATPDLTVWWTIFRDPIVDDLVNSVAGQNLTLRQAGTRILQARAVRGIAAGNLFPQIQQAIGQSGRFKLSKNAANTPPNISYFETAAGFNLAWEIDFWGRFRRAIESADANLDASIYDYDNVLVLLVADTAATYVQMRVLQYRLRLARANVAIQKGSYDIALARFQGGNTSELDPKQALSQLEQTRRLIPLLERGIRLTNNRLCVLLGIPPRDLATDIDKRAAELKLPPIPPTPLDVVAGIPADLLRRRPDVRAAERRVAAQSARIGIAESDLYPRLALGGTIQWQAEDASKLFRPESLFGFVGPTFQWNILNYGRILNSVRVEQARFGELVLGYQNSVLTAQQEVEDGLVGFLKSQEEVDHLAKSVDASLGALKIVTDQYRVGATDFNRVFNVQASLVFQQDDLASTQGNVALGLIQVYRALGGGWELLSQARQLHEGCIQIGTPVPLDD